MDPLLDIADLIPPYLVHQQSPTADQISHPILPNHPLPPNTRRTPTIINSRLLYWDDDHYNTAGDLYQQITYYSSGIIHCVRPMTNGQTHGVYVEYDESGVQVERKMYSYGVAG